MKLLTVADVAEMLRLSRSKVYALKEEIGHYKVGSTIRFDLSDVISYLDRCKVNGERARTPAPRPRLNYLKLH